MVRAFFVFGGEWRGDKRHIPIDLILSPSKDEVVELAARPTPWFDRLTMRSLSLVPLCTIYLNHRRCPRT
ncbi:hypothetical protein WH87_05355 [Devosia epidermidihirudinis]|uniref:Uncharacterized protein n=1 Tax=Devosia epidermidihirudinis TaxID=1293439 RepID=A0A0F5QFT3_9HYPH|nr:hypothetical protein WH87_05355 [Devosia epidermidihirudinis]